ncbi:methyltransferase [Vibrio sp. WJH972]
MPHTELTHFDKKLTLHRYPKRSNETFQAWDAGDEYIIKHVESLELPPNQRILVLNDQFGALAIWFSQKHQVISMNDSYVSMMGMKQNASLNKCQKIEFLSSIDPIPQDIDLVLIQIPKSNRYLSWQLTQLRQQITSHCTVIAVNKAKDIHTSTLKLFERYLGTTTTSLAWKKHRLVFTTPDINITEQVPDEISWNIEDEEIEISNRANVFSGESLDIGARFFMPNIPADPKIKHIIDLGCGNGVLSVKAAKLNPNAKITAIDESYMAVASARDNLKNNIKSDESRFNCMINNCLDNISEKSADLILCNPPFHQQNAITDHIAWQMFNDAKYVLQVGGRLLMIGNRHLGYETKLIKLFGKAQVKTITKNHKFAILQAIKS